MKISIKIYCLVLIFVLQFNFAQQTKIRSVQINSAFGNINSAVSNFKSTVGHPFNGKAESESTNFTTSFIGHSPDANISSIINLMTGWNLVSVPLKSSSMLADSIFASASSLIYTFTNTYTSASTVETGRGYWIKYDSLEFIDMIGIEVNHAVQVNEGWNLIGPFNKIVNISEVMSVPAGIISSQFYTFGGSYFPVNTLEPGRGYWVKSVSAGELNYSSLNSAAKLNTVFDLRKSNFRLEIENKNSTSKIYLIDQPVEISQFELPPKFEGSNLDVRFTNNSYADIISKEGNTFSVDSKSYPIKIRYYGKEKVLLEIISGPEIATSILEPGSEIEIIDASAKLFNLKILELPGTFALYQNYPNPFNPLTNIQFDLPETGNVKMIVYDVIGREVSKLAEGKFDAGSHKIQFGNASLPSGVYFYRLTFESAAGKVFTETKKLLMMK